MWETDDVIGTELYRNMGLALVCVFLTTLVLLANLSAALMVLLCVLLALLDIGGFMYFWGLTIDTGILVRPILLSTVMHGLCQTW